MRIVLGLFGKQFLTGLQSTVHLVGRNMVKQLIVKMALPGYLAACNILNVPITLV